MAAGSAPVPAACITVPMQPTLVNSGSTTLTWLQGSGALHSWEHLHRASACSNAMGTPLACSCQCRISDTSAHPHEIAGNLHCHSCAVASLPRHLIENMRHLAASCQVPIVCMK